MGMRSVARINTPEGRQDFYAQWGSPSYKIPALADWITGCADRREMPNARQYMNQTTGSLFDHFTETFTGTDLPGDLDWLYDLNISGDVLTGSRPTWEAELTVSGPQLWNSPAGVTDSAGDKIAHHIEFSSHDPYPLYRVAAKEAEQISAHIERVANQGYYPTASAEWWTFVAARWNA